MTAKFLTLDPTDRRLNIPPHLAGNKPRHAAISVAFTELRTRPEYASSIDTQLMYGETVKVYADEGDWSLVQADRDQYVGWLESNTLRAAANEATHLVSAPRTFFYPGPDMKFPHCGMRSMGSAVRVVDEAETRGTRFAVLEGGEAVIADHIRPLDQDETDFVTVAESLLHTPYLWAGTTAFGMDCSGLVKLAMLMTGKLVLRDSDMQAASIGSPIEVESGYENLRRGDLVFWRGHVGICMGPDTQNVQQLIHCNGHTMNVAIEPLETAIERIAYLYERPIGFRRPE